ncbi:sigma-54-dependent transcriptional regulator FlbD [Dongia deserti]|uniref:sigma-54-dependent transcriptional regulator FlbD n=1 Tax=Dongia deserti TaxID=2268030 RepID=UPI000E65D9B0|nr:sigma-54 dependent transcriptional regulator [Dongia deserti]
MRLLIVGSLDGHITAAGKIALSRGAKVAHVDDVDQAMHALRNGQGADLIMFDVVLDIQRMIDSLRTERINIPVVACGIGTSAETAVKAIKAGAKEYVPLPPDAELIAAVLAAVAEESSALIFKDPAMKAVLKLADQVAPSDASILITGESGTGKEVVARYIHAHSRRASKPFISVNCAAIPENLLESELFGHEKGSFTGAIARRIGKFEEASGGTLLLDEISEMHPRLQAKLLRAIQERVVDRVGGTQPVKVDIRLLATSNRDLQEEVRKGNFRDDLFFRLNVMSLELPALRHRPLDIQVLAEHFAKKYADANGVRITGIAPDVMDMLRAHEWRGNVRELENTMHRAVLLAQDSVIAPDAILLTGGRGIPVSALQQQTGLTAAPTAAKTASGVTSALVGRTVAAVERDLIIDTLQHCLGNRTHAANILGISIRTLRNKLKQYSEEGVPVPGSAHSESDHFSAA